MIDDSDYPAAEDARQTDIPGVFHKNQRLVVALLESASQAIISIDRTGRIVLANRRAAEMFGYTTQELLGARIEILLPESKRALHGRQRDEYFHRPRARPMGIGLDLSGRRKDGVEFPVEVSLSAVETEEGTFGIAFVSDISVRKALEEQLVQAQKMEAVGRLAGGVAHDFNNMLTVIAGYNRMILDELSPMDPLRGFAEEILKAADRAGALTNQLLAFSRRQIMQPRVINLNAVMARHEKDVAPPDRRRYRACDEPGRGCRQYQGRSEPYRAGHHEPGGQFARCHAQRRADDDRNLQCPDRRNLRQDPHGRGAGRVRHDCGERHGSRDGFRNHAADIFEPFFTTKDTEKVRDWVWPLSTASSSRAGAISGYIANPAREQHSNSTSHGWRSQPHPL